MKSGIPVIAIVGRANVGKSTLFNALAGKRISIVNDEPGVTRDRTSALVKKDDFTFTIVDTAGLFGGTVLSAGFVTADGLRDYVKSIRKYASIAADNHVDVEIQNHPLMDGFAGRLEQLKKRGAQDPHPFVIKESDYAAFLTVMSECSQAQLIRKGN